MKLALTVRETLLFCLILESIKDIERGMPFTKHNDCINFPKGNSRTVTIWQYCIWKPLPRSSSHASY